MLHDNPSFRLDGEFFRKEFLNIPAFAKRLGASADIKSGTTPLDRDDNLKEGVVLLKTTDIRNSVLSTEDGGNQYYHISSEIAVRMKETKLQAQDVLINIVGATTDVIGRVAFVPDDFPEANITQAMALVRIHDPEITPSILFSFLSGKYGSLQVRRLARPTGQYNLNLQEVASLRVPVFMSVFSSAITCCITESYELVTKSRGLRQQAEQTLLSALGLENWQPPETLSYTRSASDVFVAGRLDAEFFAPKYSKIEDRITLTGQACPLGSLLSMIQRGKQPDYGETGLPVVNSKHVTKGDVCITDDNRFAAKNSHDITIQQDDVLINGTGVGTIGRSAPYLLNTEAFPDNHVTILRSEGSVDPIYLSVFLNSIAGQLQVDKWYRGSSGQIELYPDDIAQFIIWIAPKDVQLSIRLKVEESFKAKERAGKLLVSAKRSVEIAIEQNEEAALDYLKEQEAIHG